MAKKVTKRKKKKANTGILNLYPEDFKKSWTWESVCGILNLSPGEDEGVSIKFISTKTIK